MPQTPHTIPAAVCMMLSVGLQLHGGSSGSGRWMRVRVKCAAGATFCLPGMSVVPQRRESAQVSASARWPRIRQACRLRGCSEPRRRMPFAGTGGGHSSLCLFCCVVAFGGHARDRIRRSTSCGCRRRSRSSAIRTRRGGTRRAHLREPDSDIGGLVLPYASTGRRGVGRGGCWLGLESMGSGRFRPRFVAWASRALDRACGDF